MDLRIIVAGLGASLLLAPAARADELRDLCAERPGLDTPACTVDAGHVQAELGLVDWTLDKQPDSRTDTIVAGDLLLRYGVGESTELRLGWTSYGHVRERDRLTGAVDRQSGTGDVTVGLKQNLVSPDGDGISVALLPFASLPVGGHTIGAGTWGAGLLVPASVDLSEKLSWLVTPEIDAAPDGDRHGRHLAWGSATGLGYDISDAVGASAEVQLIRDDDPSGHSTQALAGAYLTYQPDKRTQLDLGAQGGLNRESPDVEVYFGVTRKF